MSDPAHKLWSESDPPNAEPVDSSPTEAPTPKPRLANKALPTKPLPPLRVSFAKQLEVLRGHAVASEHGTKPVSNADLARVVGMHINNVCLPNPFLNAIGLIQREGTSYLPSQEAMNYQRACEWNDEAAGTKLAPVLERSWFGELVLQQVALRPRQEKDVLAALAEASGASPEYKPAILTALEYLKTAGLIAIDGGLVRQNKLQPCEAPKSATAPEPQPAAPPPAPQAAVPTVATPGARQTPPETGGVGFSYSINIGPSEMKGWTADRITAFFTGLAKVIAAAEGKEEK